MFARTKIVDPEFFVVLQCQLADDGAERDLRRFHVHLVENFFDFHDHFAVAEHDDRVGALVGDDLGVSDRDGLRRGIDRLRLELFRNVSEPPPLVPLAPGRVR